MTFFNLTSLDIFKETNGQFRDVYVATKTGILRQSMIVS